MVCSQANQGPSNQHTNKRITIHDATMSPIHKPVLSPGSRVLVTGVSGFLGSHVADQLLAGGYLVTGTTRDATKNAWVQRLFDGKYGEGKFRLAEVPDIARHGAFDNLLDGKSVLITIASPLEDQALTRSLQVSPASCTPPRTLR